MRSPIMQPGYKTPELPNLAHRFRQASQVFALLVATLGVVVLCGWAFNVPTLTYIRPTFQSMKVNTALSFLLLGAALWLAHDDKQQRSRRILGLVVLVIAGATLVEYAFRVSLGIDQLLFRDTRTPSLSAYPGRMAIATAICFLLLGLAVTFFETKKAIALQHALVGACFAISLVALCGYLYGVESLYSITAFSTVAVHTAAGFLALCVAYFLARPDEGIVAIAASDSSSGLLLRTLLPAIIGVPILIGSLRLAGQRAHLYETPFGLALQVFGSIGCLTALTLLIVRSMHRLENEQSHAEEAVRESEQRFRLVADTAPVLIWMSGTDKLCTYFNKPWLDFTGRSMEQELGNGWAEGVYPDDLQICLDTYTQSFDKREKFRMEYRLQRHDGEYRWILDIGVPRFNRDRSFAGYIGIAIDVTERKQAEQALSKSEERLRLAQQGACLGGFERDVRTGRITWSAGLESLYGLPPGSLDGKTPAFFERLIHPADFGRVGQMIENALKTGQPTEGEWRAIWPDGSVHWIASRWQVLMDASGEPSRVVGVNMDITERKLAEQRLHEYERAVEGSGEMICVVDRDYRYLIANRQFLKMRNMTREQVVGHFVHEVLNKAFFQAIVKPKLDECFQGEVVTYETKYSYPEIGERDILISYFPIEGANGIDRAACIIQDITDRKRSEEALRESERRFRLAAEAGKMYSFEWDVATDVVVRSQEHVKVLGLTEPLHFSHEQFVNTIHSDDRPRLTATIAGLTPDNPTAEIIYRVQSPDGGLIWQRSSGRAFFDSEGKMLRVIGMVADVTELKRAEEALAGMTRKLIESQEQERVRIARELHDDINQRIVLVTMELEQLQQSPSEVESRVQELRKSMVELSNDLQALSHDLHSSKLEYLGVVAGMKSWCKEFGERQKMDVDFRSDVRSVLSLDVGRPLFRVLQEALYNAFKHSSVKRIEVQLHEESGEIHLTIRDLGKGFNIEAARQGRGLGLTSMRERVRLVNGTITIESKPTCGTTIRVRVPLASEQVSARTA